MGDRFLLPLLALIALGLVAWALVWPQGIGAPSPPPFGRPIASPIAAAAIHGQTQALDP